MDNGTISLYLTFWSFGLGSLKSYFSLVFYINFIHIRKKTKMNLVLKRKKILVTFLGYTENSNKGRIDLYAFLYLTIILTYRKIYFHEYTIGKKNDYE